jgi:gamma-glutamyltranspeptidase/glutathione hydrolase
VPAGLDAMVTALSEFGTMSLADVMEPALALADDGFPMHVGLAGETPKDSDPQNAGAGASLRVFVKKFLTEWPSTGRVYLPDGEVPPIGTIIKNPSLAKFFTRLLDAESSAKNRGREAALRAASERFYRGDIAVDIVAHSDANGGLLQASDLANFKTRIETPVSAEYRGTTVHRCGPCSQDPVLLQQLKILEGFDLTAMGHNSADYIHTVIESAKLAFADREAYYADPEFVDVPVKALVSNEYGDVRRALIDGHRASMEQRPGDPVAMRPLREGGIEARAWGGGTIHVTA